MLELRESLNRHILNCRSILYLFDQMIASGRYKPYEAEITVAINTRNLDALRRIHKRHIAECLEDMPYSALRLMAKNFSIRGYSHLGRLQLIKEIMRKQDELSRADESRNARSGSQGDPIRQNSSQGISEESGGCGGLSG